MDKFQEDFYKIILTLLKSYLNAEPQGEGEGADNEEYRDRCQDHLTAPATPLFVCRWPCEKQNVDINKTDKIDEEP